MTRNAVRLIALALLSLSAIPVVRADPGVLARAYPPSCLSYPLPPDVLAPAYTSIPPIPGVVLFRRACAGHRGALMIALGGGGTDTRRAMPAIVVVQPGGEVALRAARSPNSLTEVVHTFDDVHGEIFVLELPVGGATLNLDQALNVEVRYGSDPAIVVPVTAYQPPTTPSRQPISRYLTGSWYDPAQPGEGLFLEVGENSDGSTFVFFSWFTYDASGAPYWLIGQGALIEGQPNVVVPVRTFRGGRFAGAFASAQVESAPWGEVEFSFPGCNTMTLRYAGTGTSAGAPSGTGTREWSRLVSIKGLGCQ